MYAHRAREKGLDAGSPLCPGESVCMHTGLDLFWPPSENHTTVSVGLIFGVGLCAAKAKPWIARVRGEPPGAQNA